LSRQGEKIFSCYIKKAKDRSTFAKLTGNWNRRFLTVDMRLRVLSGLR
jgi:hypothetical protein